MFTGQLSPPAKVGAVVLAAGASKRMGRPKALLEGPDGRPLLRTWLDRLRAVAGSRVVVAGALVEPIAALLAPDEALVLNERWAETGPFESLALGLAALDGVSCALVTPVDVPPASPGELERLVRAVAPAVLAWRGTPGHPALLDARAIAAVRVGPAPTGGLAAVLADAARVEADGPAACLNLNTPEEYARWLDYCSGR